MDPCHAATLALDDRGIRQNLLRSEELVPRLLRLSEWMMILGTVRLVSALGDFGAALLDGSPTWLPTWTAIANSFVPLPLVILLCSCWPLVAGIVIRKTANQAALLAGGITFSILFLGDFFNLLSPIYSRSGEPSLSVGSFTITRASLLHGALAAAIPALMGVAQLAMELATAVWAWRLCYLSSRNGKMQPDQPARSRQGLYGRVAVYISIAFF